MSEKETVSIIRIRSIRINTIYNYLVMSLIIALSGTPFCAIEQYNRIRVILSVILVLALAIPVGISISQSYRIEKNHLLIIILAFIAMFVSIIHYSTDAVGLLLKTVTFSLLLLYVSHKENKVMMLKALYNLTVIICAFASVYWILMYIFKIQIPYSMLKDGFTRYYGTIVYDRLFYVEHISTFTFYRLQGVFWEPGVLGIYIVLALYYQLVMLNNKIKISTIIIFVALVLTKSTTAWMIGIALLAVYIIRNVHNQMVKNVLFIVIASMAIVLIALVWISKKNSGSVSYSVRFKDMSTGLGIWLNNFLLGTGYNNSEAFIRICGAGNSNGFVNWCMTMGIVGFLEISVPFAFNLIKLPRKQQANQLIWSGIWVLVNMTEPLITTPIMAMLLASEYDKATCKIGER